LLYKKYLITEEKHANIPIPMRDKPIFLAQLLSHNLIKILEYIYNLNIISQTIFVFIINIIHLYNFIYYIYIYIYIYNLILHLNIVKYLFKS